MLEKLLNGIVGSLRTADDDPGQDFAERRADHRLQLAGARVAIRSRRLQSIFQLKDLSPFGASGISDLPLPVGAIIFLQLKPPHYHAAEVRWVRNMTTGLRFLRPLDSRFVERLHDRSEGPLAADPNHPKDFRTALAPR